ncbi:MAG: NADH-quinone oxidoreductase subunit NuoE [Bacteroidales bacterium]|nr:NADH-quinone oxidoreductase subunit NuoE [Bacteroidales bacterium]RLD37573.1 MAG: NADH-quinone oxidoreductase subunit NuoE [Bacteroidota bacterium]
MVQSENLIRNLVEKHGNSRNSLLPILQGIVADENYLSESSMVEVAKALDISSAEVYGTASFYSFLYTKPMGKNIIRVCKTISCKMAGKQELVTAIEKLLKIKMGETTRNMQFSLIETNCLGWCHKGPVMLINDEIYTEVSPEKAVKILCEIDPQHLTNS